MRFHTFALSALTGAALLGAAVAQTVTTEEGQPVIQGYGNFFRYRIDGLDPSLYDTPVVKVTQPRKFFIGEKPELTYSVQGGNRPYAFSLIGPELPKGLTFDPRKGNFAGTSKAVAQDSYVLAVQDAKGRVAKSDPFVVAWLDDFDESQHRTYPVEAFVGGTQLPSPQPIFDGSATTDVVASGFGATVSVKFDRQVRAKTAVVAFSTEASFGACSYDLEAKDSETNDWKAVHRAQSLTSGGVLQAFNLMPSPRSGFASEEWRVKVTNSCRMRVSELRIASAAPNPPPAWQTPEGLLVAVGPVPLGISVSAPEQSPYSNSPTVFRLADGSTLPSGFALNPNGELTGLGGEAFPYGRIDFRLRATDGIGYFIERNYYLTPDAVPARTVYPRVVSAAGGSDIRRAMNDGETGASAASASVAPGAAMLFDYGRFVQVAGGTVLAGEQVGSLVLEAEAGPDSWVDPTQVGGIAKRWRLVNEGSEVAVVTEARLDAADYNHVPEWKTAEGPWRVTDSSLRRLGLPNASGDDAQTIVVDGLRLRVEAEEQTIYSSDPAAISVAPGSQVPAGLQFDGSGIAVARGEDLPAGRVALKLRATDGLGYVKDRTFVFNPVAARARTIHPSVAAPSGDATMLTNDGRTDVSTNLSAGQSLVWTFDRYVLVQDDPAVVADNASALVLEAETADGWVAPSMVDGIAKRWRARATAPVSVSEYRLDGASPILVPTFSPDGSMRTVDQSGIAGSGSFSLAVSAAERNPYTDDLPTISASGSVPAGFAWSGTAITTPVGESFPAGRISVVLRAVDAYGVEAFQTYLFRPATVRASSLVPQVRDPSGGSSFFVLYDGAADRAVHLDAEQAVTFSFGRYVSVVAPNVVDVSDASAVVFEAQTADGWVAASAVDGIAKSFRVRATKPVDLREFRLDGADAPGAPAWSTSAGPYVVDENRVAGQIARSLQVSAAVRNSLADPATIYSVQGATPDLFGFTSSGPTITTPRGSSFGAGRQTLTIRAADSTGFFTDRTFVFNPYSVPAQPIKPDVRDPANADVFGILSDGRDLSGLNLLDGQAVVLDYGQDYVKAARPATVTATGGTTVIEAETSAGWVAAADVDWIARRFRVRAVGAVFLSEARLDGLPAQAGPRWYPGWNQVVTVSAPMYVGFSAEPQSTFATGSVVYSAPQGLPPGFTLGQGRLDIPAGEQLPAGYTPIRIRATDNVGVYSEIDVPLQPDAPRAVSVRSTIKAPDGSDVYTTMTDGAVGDGAAGVDLVVGQSVELDFGRYVLLYFGATIEGSGTFVLEAATASGWVDPASVNLRAKKYRVRATAAVRLREARLDGLAIQQPPVWATLGDLRTVDQNGLSLPLAVTIRSSFGSPPAFAATTPLPTGFSIASAGTLTAPPGESFPTGAVSFTVRATDAVGFTADRTFAFAPDTVRAATVAPTSIIDPTGKSAVQTLNDDVKGASAPGIALTSGQTVVWTFPRYVKVVPSASVVDATAPAAIVLETDGGTAGWVAATALDTGKRFRIRATAATTVREYRLDGVGAFVLPTYTTAASPWETSPTAVSGQPGLALKVVATNNSPFAGAMTYAQVPASSLPSGFSVATDGTVVVPSADVFPSGRVDVPVRATDPVGNFVDRTFTFHPLGVAASTAAPTTVADGGGADVRVAMLDGRIASTDVSTTLATGQSLVFDYGTRWVRISAASIFDVAPTGAVLETVAADGSWVQISATPATAFPAAVQDQGGRRFRLRQATGTSTLREARLGGLPQLGPVWTTAATARAVSQTTIAGLSPDSLTLVLSATKSAATASAVAYAWAPGFVPPQGFTLASTGGLTTPQGESFPYGRVDAAVRATTDDYTQDRTFAFNPATVRLNSVAPDSVFDKNSASVVTTLYDGATGTSAAGVSLAAGESVVWTYPRYVQNVAAAVTDGVNLANVVLEVERTSGEWVVPASVDSIGRRWRIRATAAATVREYRLDGATTYLSPTWITAGGTRIVTATAITGTSPASLSLQLQATNRSPYTSDPLKYQMAPGSAALPTGFALTTAGVLTAPSAPNFTAGNINFTVRVYDSTGFFTDQAFNFTPEVVAMTALLPSSVTGPDGKDVYVALYSGLNDTTVPVAVGQSITWTFSRYVSPAAASVFAGIPSQPALVLETPAQDGSWTSVFAVSSAALSPAANTTAAAYGRTYRLRNTVATTQPVTTARLGGVPALAPVWTTPNANSYGVSQVAISYVGTGSTVGSGLKLPLAAAMQATGGTGLTYAAAPGSSLPTGFVLASDGNLTVPQGESFPGANPTLTIRATDTKGFYADRVFTFYPNFSAAQLVPPSGATAPDGSDAFTILYDGRTDRTVSIPPGGAVSFTFPSYVGVTLAASATTPNNSSPNNVLQLQNLRADGTWAPVETYAVVSNSAVNRLSAGSYFSNVGREWRLMNMGSTGTVVLSEFRIDGASPLAPTITTSSGPWEVNQSTVVGASPAALSLQLASTKAYSGSTSTLTYALAPTSLPMPGNFGLSNSGLIVVPQGEQFPYGRVDLMVRSTDSRGFYTDKGFGFYPTTVRASSVPPTSVLDESGNDVYPALYDGDGTTFVGLAVGKSVVYTFPQFVRLAAISAASSSSGSTVYLERQLQDGSWAMVEYQTGGSAATLPSVSGYDNASKVYRLRNAGTSQSNVAEYRLDAGAVRTPSWTSSTGPYFVSETVLSTSSGGAAVSGSTGLALSVAATSQTATALTYSAAPGSTLPSGYSVSSSGVVTVAPASQMPSGRVDVVVRAKDAHGLFADRTFSFVPSGAPRANSLPPMAVTGPAGENLLPVLYDGRSDTNFALKPNEAVVYAWDRFVQISADAIYAITPGANGAVYSLQAMQSDGSWKQIGSLSVNSGTYAASLQSVADQFGRTFRIVNTGTATSTFGEVRLDGAQSYGVVVSTSTTTRTVAAAISGTNPASLSLQLSATRAHPASTGSTWSLRSAMPIGFTISSDGILSMPQGSDFPFGNVAFPVRATDNLGFAGDASFGFKPAGVRGYNVLPVSVVGPNNEDLLRPMYDGLSTTSITLSQNQSITYTFDRFVTLAAFTNTTLGSTSNQYFVEIPNQAGGWSVAATVTNWNGTAAGATTLADDFLTSKIFRVRNALAAPLAVLNLPFDGSDYLGPTITTSGAMRTVSATTIDGASPATLSLQMAATDNYSGAGTLAWTMVGTPPAGFSISQDGLLTVPAGPDMPNGYNLAVVRVTDQGGFYKDLALPFRPTSVAAATVVPQSVTGPAGQDAFVTLYDGSGAAAVTLQGNNTDSITYTFDRYVSVSNLSVSNNGYSADINYRLVLEVPNQSGGWSQGGTLYRYNNGSASAGGVTDLNFVVSKVFRLRNIFGLSFAVTEARLDNPASYGLVLNTAQTTRTVDQNGISGVSPAGFGLQLAATSGYPGGSAVSWAPVGTLPGGFSLASGGLLTVPAGADFPFGYVAIPAKATDDKGFSTTGSYVFVPTSVRANMVMPVSVTGQGGEDVLPPLYDGKVSTTYALPASGSATYVYDRFVTIADVATAAGAYQVSMAAGGYVYVEVPNQVGGWTTTHSFYSAGGALFSSTSILSPAYNQSKVFRIRNVSAASAALQEFRLDNVATYGITWLQSAGTFYVSETAISASNGGTAVAGTSGMNLPLTATSGYPGGSTVSYAWVPGYTPPDGFVLSGSTLTIPAGSAFPAGNVQLQIRVSDARGFSSLDRVFTFVPTSVRANSLPPGSVVGPSGQSVAVGLYDDDASNSSTVAASLAPGQSITWTYPQWTYLTSNSTVVAGTASTLLYLERQFGDGSWQVVETRNMSTSAVSLANSGDMLPSKAWRLRNGGSVAASLIEWRIDGAPSYAPVLSTSLAARYVTPTSIVDALGSTVPSSATSGLTLRLAGTVASPGGGSLAYAWTPGFTPPDGYSLTGDGVLSVPDRDSMPTGQAMLSFSLTDPRGFAITRVTTFVADSVRAKDVVASATVTSPDGRNVFSAMVDGASSPTVSLAAGEAITWSFPRYAYLGAVSPQTVSASTWQIEIPNQSGGWNAVETGAGLVGTSTAARTSRTFRLRNTGSAAITVGEYAIDGAAQGTAPSGGPGLLTAYSGTAISIQATAVPNDPYFGTVTFAPRGALPSGFAVTSAGLISVDADIDVPANGTSIPVVLTNGLGRTADATYVLYDSRKTVPISTYGQTRYYADGTYAQTCAAYTKTNGRYIYAGATGNGTYRIDPDGSGPIAPQDLTCSDMSTATPGTAVPALLPGTHGFPGDNSTTYRNWVNTDWRAFYLAVAALSDKETIIGSGASEPCCDSYGFRNVGGTLTTSFKGATSGYDITLGRNAQNAFDSSFYSTDSSVNGGGGLSISSSIAIFR